MAQYSKGTVDVTNGSATVTGNSTAFLTNVSVGDDFLRTSDGVVYDIAAVVSDTQITLSVPYQGVTGSAVTYTIQRDFTANYGFPYLNQGDIETATITARATKEVDAQLGSFVPDANTYTDNAISAHKTESSAHDAVNIDYDNTSSGLTATNVQAAVDEVDVNLDGHIGSTNGHPDATTSTSGFMSGADKTKLDGVETGAQVNTVDSVDGMTGAVDLSSSYEQKRQNNLTATTDPTVTDDSSAGYEPLSRWINTSTGEIWLCVDAATGAANWQKASLTLDELGSAALADVGAGEAQLPRNSDLGSAAVADILGAVSQSSGVPTGAIIERGSNANGTYAKFADGTLICERVSTETFPVGATGYSWNFPSGFLNQPFVDGRMIAGNSNSHLWGAEGAGTNGVSGFFFNDTGTSKTGPFLFFAFGRWF